MTINISKSFLSGTKLVVWAITRYDFSAQASTPLLAFYFLKTSLEYDLDVTFNISNIFRSDTELPVWAITLKDFPTIEKNNFQAIYFL